MMKTDRLSAVTAAVLADAAFDVTAETTRFSTPRYREIIEHIRRSGEMPHQPWCPTPATDINISSPRQMAPTHSWRQPGVPITLLRDITVTVLLALLASAAGIVWINLALPDVWPPWIEPWSS
jgi:hypothetical protein